MAVVTSKNANGTNGFRPDINGLRAIAVAAVVLFHFRVPGFTGGFLGVDVFFVISGFLMTKIIVGKLETDCFSIRDFWLARARRIFPGLAALCGILLPLGWLSLDPIAYWTLAWHAASSLTFLSNLIFWNEVGYFDSAAHEKWLLHTWSLSVEWQFYILFPIAMKIIKSVFKSHRAMVGAVLGAFALSLTISIIVTPLRPDAAYYLLPTRAWEMMAGGLVYFASPYFLFNAGLRHLMELIGILLIVVGVAWLNAGDSWPGYLALIPVLGTALVILSGNTSSIITCNPVSKFIGETSYSIYLWHWPIVVLVAHQHWENSWVVTVLGIALATILGWLSYRFVEVPVRRVQIRPRFVEVSRYIVAATILLGVSLGIRYYQGFPARLGLGQESYQKTAAAFGDWGHPDMHCDVKIYETRCYNPGNTRNLLMFIGDSHAEQWYPRYGNLVRHQNNSTLFITKGACLPVRGVESLALGANCTEFANSAWAEVYHLKPQKLVISSIWLTYFYYSTGEVRDSICLTNVSECIHVTDEEKREQVFKSLENDIRRAKNSGIDIYILGPTPMSGVDYPKIKMNELAGRYLWLPVAQIERGTVKSGFLNDDKVYSRATIIKMLEQVAHNSGATLILTDQHMCPNGVCMYIDASGSPIFKDRDHLRKSYVQSDAFIWLDQLLGMNK
ncbi:MAG: acyltransferase family protein [Steroidobacteraceae bacterium]